VSANVTIAAAQVSDHSRATHPAHVVKTVPVVQTLPASAVAEYDRPAGIGALTRQRPHIANYPA